VARTIRDWVDRRADETPDATYLIAPEIGRTLSFGELRLTSRRLAGFLAARGARPGERIALLMPNGFQTCRLFIGVMYGGYCVTPVNLLAQPSQLAYVLDHCDARIVFVSPDQVERLDEAMKGIARRIDIVVCDPDAAEFADAAPEDRLPPVSEDTDALMMYTSGTTGKPKGVVLAHRAVIAGGEYVSRAHKLTPADRVMAVLPLYHINAQIVTATAPLVHGGSLVLPRKFSATTYWETVAAQGCTWINVVPTIIAYLLNGETPQEKGLDISRVRFCRSASAPLAPAHHRAFEEKFHIGIIETMGLTETAAPCFTNPLDPALRKIGSPGQAFGNEGKVVGAAGTELPRGEIGEIMVRGDNVMTGLLQEPGGNGEVADCRRLAAHRRPRLHGRGRLRLRHRAAEGTDHQGRREHCAARNRRGPAEAPGTAGGGGGGCSRRGPTGRRSSPVSLPSPGSSAVSRNCGTTARSPWAATRRRANSALSMTCPRGPRARSSGSSWSTSSVDGT
jgi:long-chain acyl-CoA synthetase